MNTTSMECCFACCRGTLRLAPWRTRRRPGARRGFRGAVEYPLGRWRGGSGIIATLLSAHVGCRHHGRADVSQHSDINRFPRRPSGKAAGPRESPANKAEELQRENQKTAAENAVPRGRKGCRTYTTTRRRTASAAARLDHRVAQKSQGWERRVRGPGPVEAL